MHGTCNLVEPQRTRHLLPLQCLCCVTVVRCRKSIDNGCGRHIHCNTMIKNEQHPFKKYQWLRLNICCGCSDFKWSNDYSRYKSFRFGLNKFSFAAEWQLRSKSIFTIFAIECEQFVKFSKIFSVWWYWISRQCTYISIQIANG